MSQEFEKLSPQAIVNELDKHIIGQHKAKRAVAVALRNRYRRKQLPKAMQEEVIPKNIIMIGATGVGKTEIARRLTKLCAAPFIKVEATKFTEVGYVGRDVESMVRDLMTNALALVKNEMTFAVATEAERRTYDRLVDLLLAHFEDQKDASIDNPEQLPAIKLSHEHLFAQLKGGLLDDVKIEIPASPPQGVPTMEIFPVGLGIGSGDMGSSLDNITSHIGSLLGGRKKRLVTVARAFDLFLQEEKDRLIDNDSAIDLAKERVETMGVIFIDEIDKIASKNSQGSSPDISREGVQRDILPIVEGSLVNTKYGSIDTSHILFIAAGAFNIAKPSDLIPELQGRFPIRVELEPMTAEIFEQILTQPQNSLIQQYQAMLATERLTLHFTNDGIKQLAQVAAIQNATRQNIGARRLHSVLEQVLEELSFNAPDYAEQTITIDADYVVAQCAKEVLDEENLERYIL
jgi:ATP-dependent HslUV protease ATP-binding subunit HslU